MAYLFSKLNEAIEGQGGKRASDVLQGGAPQDDREQASGAPQGNSIATQPSAIIGAGGSGPKPAAAGEDATAVNSDSRNKVMAKNAEAGKNLTANAADSLATGVKQSQDTLQSQADAYMKDNYGGFERGNVDKALDANDVDSRGAVSKFIDGPAGTQANFSINDASLDGLRNETIALQKNGGLKNALQAQGDSNYTSGEANLDASFLKTSEAFKRQKAGVINAFAAQNAAQTSAIDAAKVHKADYTKNYAAEQKAVKDLLAQKAGGIRSLVDATVAEKNAGLAASRGSARGVEEVRVRDDAKAQLAELERSAKALTPTITGQGPAAMAPKFDPKQVAAMRAALQDMVDNPGKYVSQASNTYAADDVATDDQVDDYGWLNSVLGGKTPGLARTQGRVFDSTAARTGSVGSNLKAGSELLTALQKTQEDKKRKAEWVDPDEGKRGIYGQVQDGAEAFFKGLDPTVAAKNLSGNLGGFGNAFGGGRNAPAPTPLEKYTADQAGWQEKQKREIGTLVSKPYPTAAEIKKMEAWNKANPAPKKSQYGMTDTAPAMSQIGVGEDTSGKHLCGAMHALGHLPDAIYAADLAYAVTVAPCIKRGYTFWALPLSEIARKSPRVARVCRPFVVCWANEMAGNTSLLGRFLKRFGEPVCGLIGRVV